MIATSLASAARPLWRLLERYGVDPEQFFRESGLDPKQLNEPRARYRVERVTIAWNNASRLVADPCFGLKIAEVWSLTDLHALGYAFCASSSLRTAFGRLCRYAYVVDNVVGLETVDDEERTTVIHTTAPSIDLAHSEQRENIVWTYFLSLCRQSYGEELRPIEVRFRRPRLPCRSDYDALFRCPVRFDSDTSAIVFSRADIDRPLPAANRDLARANDRILSDFLDKLSEGDLVAQVKSAIAKELPSGAPSDDEIAKTVFMSPRTLQRKLAAQGTSYSKLLDAVRRELAEQYIADPSLSLSEISFLLGFSEHSAFSRAFRRWTGQAPSAAREPTAE